MNGDAGVLLNFDGEVITPSAGRIRQFADIPDIITMPIPAMEYTVPALGIARNTLTLWTAPDGDGKTFVAESMAVAVAQGDEFLDMRCQQSPVLYVDLENPAYAVQHRLRLMVGEKSTPNLRVWGIWCDQQPPHAMDELLLDICEQTRPLVIIDPFRYFHQAEENDSTAMSGVMQYLRACASYGCAVVILHHPAKAEGSTGRGSSVIRGACDLAFLHSLDKDTGLITLKVDKNRFGESRAISLRANFQEGKFEPVDAPWLVKRKEDIAKLEGIIKANPGQSQNSVYEQSGMQKSRVLELLGEGNHTHWVVKPGPNKAKLYYPIERFLASENHLEQREPLPVENGGGLFCGSPLKGREPQNHSTAAPFSVSEPAATHKTGEDASEKLCAEHGWHNEWVLEGEALRCGKCRSGEREAGNNHMVAGGLEFGSAVAEKSSGDLFSKTSGREQAWKADQCATETQNH